MLRKLSLQAVVILLRLAWRNLWRHPRRTLITASTITLGMVLAIFFISVGDGSHQAMVRQAIKMGHGHITIQPKEYLASPHNQLFLQNGLQLQAQLRQLGLPMQVAPRTELQVLCSTAYQSEGVRLLGLIPDEDPFVNELTKNHPLIGEPLARDDAQGVWIGMALANRLRVTVGSKIVTLAGRQGDDALSHLFRVRGVFKTGVKELDRYLMVSSIHASHHLLSENIDAVAQTATRLAVFLDAESSLIQQKEIITSRLFGFNDGADKAGVLSTDGYGVSQRVAVLSWQEVMPDLVQFIAVDDAGNYVFLALILVLVIFGIVNTVLMSVLERTREFGLWVALGLRPGYLWALVIIESIFLGLLSAAGGWFLGGLVYLWFSRKGLDLSGLMDAGTELMGTVMEPVIFAHLSWDRVIQLTMIVIVSTLLSGLLPAFKAARVSPLRAMRT